MLSVQRSSATPAGGQSHPSPPCGHLPLLLLAVQFIPPCPTVILHPYCWRSNSPLSAQWSSSNPAGSQPQNFPTQRTSSTPPASSQLHLSPRLYWCFKGRAVKRWGGLWRGETRDGRRGRETRDEWWETGNWRRGMGLRGDGRWEMW